MIIFKSFLTALFFYISINSIACSCHNDIEEMNMARYNDCVTVFTGTPDSLGTCESKGRTVVFNIIKCFKGNYSGKIKIEGISCSGSCAFTFEKQQNYLMYLYPDAELKYKIIPCTGTRKILSEEEINNSLVQAQKYNVHSSIENEIKLWRHEMDLLEKVSEQKNGTINTEYINGKSTGKGKLKNGLAVGEWKYYYPSGALKSKGHYENGKKTGMWIEYTSYYETFADTSNVDTRKKFLLKSSGRYVDGLKEGKWERHNLDGSVQVLFYRRGKFTGEKD